MIARKPTTLLSTLVVLIIFLVVAVSCTFTAPTGEEAGSPVASGDESPTNGTQDEPPQPPENLFDPRKVSVGDSIVGLTITDIPDIREYGWLESDFPSAIVKFKGEVTLTGRYYCDSVEEQELSGHVSGHPQPHFFVDEEPSARLPWIDGDTRAVHFIITNYEDALELLGPPGYDVQATIVIDDYVIRHHNSSEGMNFARLVRVVEKHGPDYETISPQNERFSLSTGNIHDYMPRLLAGEDVSDYELLPCLENFTIATWSELHEAYDKHNPEAPGGHWFNVLFATLEDAAVSPNPDDSEDQAARNYYIGKALLASDGAYSEGLAPFLVNQWTSDPVLYSSSLNRFFPSEDACTLRQSIALTIRYWHDVRDPHDSQFGIAKPIVENRAYPGGMYLVTYPLDFPFCFDLPEKSRETYRAESFGQVTVVESDDMQVTYLTPADGVYTIITLRAKDRPYWAAGVKIGDTEESLSTHFGPNKLRKVDRISYDDEAWFGGEYDCAYAYTPKDSTKSVVYIITNGLVSGIDVVNGLDGPIY